MSVQTRVRKPIRRLGRWAAVACALAGVMAAVGYAVLPWMIPRGWLADRLAARLSGVMQRPVTIDAVDIGYGTGVVIDGLRMARRPGFGDGLLMQAQRIVLPVDDRARLSYDLLAMVWDERIVPVRAIEITGLACWIVADDRGRLNIGDLNDQGGTTLPAVAYDFANLSLHFEDRRHSTRPPQALQLPAFSLRLDPATGRMTWRGAGAFGSALDSVNLTGDVLVPRLHRAVALAGGGEISWDDVQLSDLPAALWPAGVDAVDGTTAGTLRIEATPELDVLFDLDVNLHGPRATWTDGVSLAADGLVAHAAGTWSSAGRTLTVDRLHLEEQGRWLVAGAGPAPVVTLDDRPFAASARLRATVTDGPRALSLAARWGLDHGAWNTAGPFEVQAEGRWTTAGIELETTLRADAAEITGPHDIRLAAGMPKELAVQLQQEDGAWAVRSLDGRVGPSSVELQDFVPGAPIADHLHRGRVVLAGEHVREWAAHVRPDAVVDGDVRVVVEAIRHPDDIEFMLQVDAASDARVLWADWVDKPVDAALHIRGTGRARDVNVRDVEDVRLEVRCGVLRLAVSDGRSAAVSGEAGEWGALRAPFDVEGLEHVGALLPFLRAPVAEMGLAGAARGRIEANMGLDDDRIRLYADIDAADTAFSHEGMIKIAGHRGRLRLDYAARASGRTLAWSADLEGGRFDGRTTWQGTNLRSVAWSADAAAVEHLLDMVPALRERVAPLAPSGAASFEWRGRYDGAAIDFEARADLSATRLCFDGGTPCRTPGRALRLDAAGRIVEHGATGAHVRVDHVGLEAGTSSASAAGDVRVTLDEHGAFAGWGPCTLNGHVDWAVGDSAPLVEHVGWTAVALAGWVHADVAVEHRGAPARWTSAALIDLADAELATAWGRKPRGAHAAVALSSSDGRLEADVYVAHAEAVDAHGGVPGAIDELVGTYRGGPGWWRLEGRGSLSGGLLSAELGGDGLTHFALHGAAPSPDLIRRCRAAFPMMTPEGPISVERTAVRADDDPEVIARGEMVVEGGALIGKAAPSWMTRLFPRLNLARFTFGRMHDWYTVYADGRIRHAAIFQGKHYHLYITGEQVPDGTVDYVVGIDLLAGQESPYWVEVGGGRIQLFRTVMSGGADGNVVEESVNYVPLRFVKALLWDSNPLYTAYHALRKRVLGRE